MPKFILTNGYPNSAFEKYDKHVSDTHGHGETYRAMWHKELQNEYFAEFGCMIDTGHRFVDIPDQYYTLFLLKYS